MEPKKQEPEKEDLLEYIDYFQDILDGGVTAKEISTASGIDLDTIIEQLQKYRIK